MKEQSHAGSVLQRKPYATGPPYPQAGRPCTPKRRSMTFFEENALSKSPGALRVHIPTTQLEIFVNTMYSFVDEAARVELKRLCIKDCVIASCKLGCCHCCGQYILTNVAEAHTLAQYVRREFSIDQIAALRIRTQKWHEWNDSMPGRYPSTPIHVRKDISDTHPCPMLVKGACSVYPVRPVICRTHFVCSDPTACCPSSDPESIAEIPVVLMSIITATSPFSMRIRQRIETEGLDFCQSVMLLPHWLAIEMGWDFVLSH